MVRSELDSEDHHGNRGKERKGDRDRDEDAERDRERIRDRDKAKDRDKERIREKEKLKDKDRDKEKGRDRDRDRDREKEREKDRARDREKERDRDNRERDNDRDRGRNREEKDRERSRDRDERDERDRDRNREKDRERFRESSKDLEKEKDRDRDRLKDSDDKVRDSSRHKDKDKDEKKKDRAKDRGAIDKGREADSRREADLAKEKKKEKDKRERDGEKDRERERDRDRGRERDRERDGDRERERNKEIRDFDRGREHCKQKEFERSLDSDLEHGAKDELDSDFKPPQGTRGGKKETGGEIAAWISKSRNLEEQKKLEERIKAARMARLLSEQDSGEESEDEDKSAYGGKDLAGLKVLHGVDKVLEGGAVVLTLKDKGILVGDDVNEDIDELENLEISQQIGRDKAYQAAKKKLGVYEDKFQNDINAVRPILPQYDEEMDDGMTLDETGGINEEGRQRLEELRKKLQGGEEKPHESLFGSPHVASDFFTSEEMLQFNKPKKKKKLRKKEKLDLDALEVEAKAEDLVVDHGSRLSNVIQVQKLEKEKAAEESRNSAYLNAYIKAVDASQKLKSGPVVDLESEDAVVYGGEEDDELERSLQRARQAALKKQSENGAVSAGPQAVASALLLANDAAHGSIDDTVDKDKTAVVFTETEEFCRNIQLDEVLLKRPGKKDVFGEDDEPTMEKSAGLDGGWMEINEDKKDEEMEEQQAEEDPSTEEAVAEVTVGKGLAGALHLLKERGTLKETVDWGGRNMDKKKSKLAGIVGQEDKFKNREIILDRVDEFGRVMTPKESFRKLSHKFHGKGPGKMKQEKRMKQYEEEMKLKQMTSGDTPLLSMEKMRDAQAKLHTPYIVISGQIKPGQTSDPRSGFGTIEKESIGSLTPMLGDQKVEYFLGIKRKPEGGSMKPPLPKKLKSDK
ncbi:hypothetical protein L7F22_002710 [Adiantum nelumboides]|nr:hypothetical protein [Adiantum nelumboides]